MKQKRSKMNRPIITTIIVFLSLIPVLVFSQSNNTASSIELNWKLDQGDTLSYETVLTEIEASNIDIDFEDLFVQLEDSSALKQKEAGEALYKQLKKLQTNTNLITKLTNSENVADVITIETIAIPKEVNQQEGEDGMSQLMNTMMRGTMLRGSVYKTGILHSFWVKSNQKNLISLLFELPNHTVNVGDSWSLNNVNLIANDQNFICEKSERKNTITLTKVNVIDGETIAVLEYDILEYVSGDFKAPALFGNKNGNQKTTMKFVYKAQAEFSVDQGKWLNYNGLMSLNATGALATTQKQKFALIEK